jgi:predicted TIM-barrel fold metal-dependent hydrolase
MVEIPKMISVDDHIVEPPTLWQDRLPAKYKDRAPRVERRRGRVEPGGRAGATVIPDDSPDTPEVDVWLYDDLAWPLTRGYAHVGFMDESAMKGVTYDDILPGCWQAEARIADMDLNHTEASISFPTFPRFCGQTFMEREDKELALLCVKAYNDFLIDDWGTVGRGRLIPLTLIPLWDAELAAAEVRRCADKGSHAMAFSEAPYELGLPSIHSGFWDPVWDACDETDTVVNMHIGSSSKLPTTSPDAPFETIPALNAMNSMKCFVDWMLSGHLVHRPNLKIALSEGQIGWMPFYLERLDSIWERGDRYGDLRSKIPERPSSYLNRVYGCVYDDVHGLRSYDVLGDSQIMFEIDYPHADSTFPESKQTAQKLVDAAGFNQEQTNKFVRLNAIECYGLDKYFGVKP